MSARTSRGESPARGTTAESRSPGPRRQQLTRAFETGVAHVADNPLAAVAGAAAVTAGIAMLLPAGRRETVIMGEVAETVGDVARSAADSVLEAGRSQMTQVATEALASIGGAVLAQVTDERRPS